MSQTSKAYDDLSAAVAGAAISPELKNAPVIAILHGPKEVIECVVQKASRQSGLAMDWGYVGGRAYVHCSGNRVEARSALYFAMPGGDISQADA